MDDQDREILKTVEEFAKRLPKFSDGRIDYSKSKAAPVITVFIKYEGKVLLLKRSDKVSTYKEKWNTVAGYIDEPKPLREKVVEEIRDEVGIGEGNILSIRTGKPYEFTDKKVNKTWIVHPVLVEVKNNPAIKLDWEHTKYKWIIPEELKKFDIVPKLDKSLKNVFV